MEFYTEKGVQELANRKCKAVCAWIPKSGGVVLQALGEHKWVVDPKGKVKEFAMGNTRHSVRRVFRPERSGK